MPKRAIQKSIVWKNNHNDLYHNNQKSLRPLHYIPDHVLDEETIKKYEPYLKVGALWNVASQWLICTFSQNGYEKPPHPYVHGSDWPPSNDTIISYPHKTIAIYFGFARVNEIKSNGQLISLIRHTFIVKDNVYLTRNLVDFKPIMCM